MALCRSLFRNGRANLASAWLWVLRRRTCSGWEEIRYGARMLGQRPWFTLVWIITLALGIGGSTAIFSVVHAVLIRPLPYRNSDRGVWLSNRNRALGVSGTFLNDADILDYRDQAQSFDQIASWGTLPLNLYGAITPERVEGVYVTTNFFQP